MRKCTSGTKGKSYFVNLFGEGICLSLDTVRKHETDFVQHIRKPALVCVGTFVYVSGGGTYETAGECLCVCGLKVLRSLPEVTSTLWCGLGTYVFIGRNPTLCL